MIPAQAGSYLGGDGLANGLMQILGPQRAEAEFIAPQTPRDLRTDVFRGAFMQDIDGFIFQAARYHLLGLHELEQQCVRPLLAIEFEQFGDRQPAQALRA